MKRVANLWNDLVFFENVLLAYHRAAKGKGLKRYVLDFVDDFEHNILILQESLINKTYHPGNYSTFFIYEPKKRMISAAPFIDRIVHHCLINVIGPIFEKTFIQQSFANQIGKGTHQAIRYVQNAMRLKKYVLQCDIRKYFPSIDHEILKLFIRKKIKDPNVLWLIDLVIENSNPQELVVDYFPGDMLFTPIEKKKGLPIGNLTSQFFANIYLNGFDHFVKERLKCRFYARYVDDFVILGNSKNHLWKIFREIEDYLKNIRLRLNLNKSNIVPVNRGIRFLGQFIYPNRRLLPKENIRKFMRRMKEFQRQYFVGSISLPEINHSLQSWLGHAKQAHTFALRKELLGKIKFVKSS